jgi:hypothetical protein
MDGPKTPDEWIGAIRLIHRCLGIREHSLKEVAADIFIDIKSL